MTKKGKTSKAEVIGALIRVIDAKNPSIIGSEGIAVDETRHTISIQTGNRVKKLAKDQVTIEINGKKTNDISGRIEERIKG